MKKSSINFRRSRALFRWACNQRASRLASLLISVLSKTQIKEICEGEGIKIEE